MDLFSELEALLKIITMRDLLQLQIESSKYDKTAHSLVENANASLSYVEQESHLLQQKQHAQQKHSSQQQTAIEQLQQQVQELKMQMETGEKDEQELKTDGTYKH